VIGTGTLRLNGSATKRDELNFARSKYFIDEMPTDVVAVCNFTVTVPAGLARYGVTIGSGHGTTWFTAAQMSHGPAVSLGSLTGPDPQSYRPRAALMDAESGWLPK
jgi:hypothetical protein